MSSSVSKSSTILWLARWQLQFTLAVLHWLTLKLISNQGQLFTKVAHFTKSGMRTILLVPLWQLAMFLSFLCCAIYFLLRTQIVIYRVGLTPSHPDIHIARLRFPVVHWPSQIQETPFTTLFPVGRLEFTPKTSLATSWNGRNMFVVSYLRNGCYLIYEWAGVVTGYVNGKCRNSIQYG